MLKNAVRIAVVLAAFGSTSLLMTQSSQAVELNCRVDSIKTMSGAALPNVTFRTCLEMNGDQRRGAIHVDNKSASQVLTVQVNGGLTFPQYEISNCIVNVLPNSSADCISDWATDTQPEDNLVGEVAAGVNGSSFDRATGVSQSVHSATALLMVLNSGS